MTPQYRAELKALRARTRTLIRDASHIWHEAKRDVKRIERETCKILDPIRKEAAAIDKRRLILEGRLGK